VKVQAIIPTAGTGTRLGADLPKPLIELNGKPLCVRTLEAFERSPVVESVILVGQPERLSDLKNLVDRHDLKKVRRIVAGGKTRRESVGNGLDALDGDTEIVMVHDGARPLVSEQIINDAAELCRDWEAVIVAVPVKSTIKKVNGKDLFVEETPDRRELWETQTPQVFKKNILLKAHAQNKGGEPTDDAAMVEQLGVRVKILPGDYRNIKITTREDLTIAEAFMRSEEQ